jgi:HK97 family phage prohead protease
MTKEIERRSIRTELRVAAGGDGGVLKGYAASYNVLSAPIPGGKRGYFREKIAPGAFDAAIRRGDDVCCLQQHNASIVLGRTTSGTLKLRTDSRGLSFECMLPPTQAAQDLRTLVARGDVRECSFGFTDCDDDWSECDDPESGLRCMLRTVKSLTLLDVSAVVYPAYPNATTLEARSQRADYWLGLGQEEEKEFWRRAFDFQMKRDGF